MRGKEMKAYAGPLEQTRGAIMIAMAGGATGERSVPCASLVAQGWPALASSASQSAFHQQGAQTGQHAAPVAGPFELAVARLHRARWDATVAQAIARTARTPLALAATQAAWRIYQEAEFEALAAVRARLVARTHPLP